MADSGLRVRGGGIDTHRPKASVTKPEASRGGGLEGGVPPRRLEKRKKNEAHFGGILGVCKV